jgi:hypothetical protein
MGVWASGPEVSLILRAGGTQLGGVYALIHERSMADNWNHTGQSRPDLGSIYPAFSALQSSWEYYG